MDKLREDIHILWEYVTVSDDSATSKSSSGDKADSATPDTKTVDPKQSSSGKTQSNTKEDMDQILRQFNKLKGENSTLYA